MLAESHSRLLQHLQAFTFFDAAAVPERIYYISAFHALRTEGLKGVVEVLRNEMRTRKAGLVVLDGLVIAAAAAETDEQLKVFINDIQTHSVLNGCTTLLLTSDDPDRPVSAEQTMVDGILVLREKSYGVRRERNLELVKFRGSATLRGNHTLRIDADGIRVYPRLEAARRAGPDAGIERMPLSTGIRRLDQMFDIGGYARGSISVVCGGSGSGKTSLGLHFAAQAKAGEKALFFGFYESPEFLADIAKMQGIDRTGVLSGPDVHFVWHPFGENVLDELSESLLRHVREVRPQRLVIDGIGGFYATPSFPERGGPFLATLMNELRRMSVTTLITVEEDLPGSRHTMDTATMSALADTIVNVRVDKQQHVRRLLWIGKSRVSRSDLRVREVTLGEAGFELKDGEPA
jgi:circadian clock protein KaiC